MALIAKSLVPLLLPTGLFETFYKPEKIGIFRDRVLPGLVDSSGMNARTIAQDSVMSIHSADNATMNESTLGRFIVAGNRKSETIWSLRSFGITRERMFADLTTVANMFRSDLETDYIFGLDPEDVERDETAQNPQFDLRSIGRVPLK